MGTAGAPVPPLKWNRQHVMRFISSLEGGRFSSMSGRFAVTGSQLYGMSKHDIIRRCGGLSRCAAFNTEGHVLNQADRVEDGKCDTSSYPSAASETKEDAIALAEEAGESIFEA